MRKALKKEKLVVGIRLKGILGKLLMGLRHKQVVEGDRKTQVFLGWETQNTETLS